MYQFREIDCAVCGGHSVKVLGMRAPLSFPEREARVVRCTSCGLIYTNPMPFPEKEQVLENFGDASSYFPSKEDDRLECYDGILKGIEGYVQGRGRLLDVGCGRGELVYAAQKMGWEAIGTDISESFVRYARKRFHIDARAGNLEDIGFPAESFDAVSLVSVLQCCHEPTALLKEINRILRKGGVLFIETTNYDGLLYILGDFFYRIMGQNRTTRLFPLSPGYEVYGFSCRSLKEILLRTGFEILDIKTSGSIAGGKGFKAKDMRTAALYFLRYGVLVLGIALGKGQLLNAWAKKG